MVTITWFKVDDGFWCNPKTLQVSNDALALWLRAGTWASQQLTDGRVPGRALALFDASRDEAGELVDAGLWDAEGDVFAFHDWAEYQPSAETEKAKRAARAAAGRKGAEARWNGKTDGKRHSKRHSKSHGKPDGKPDAPSRPVPSRPEESATHSSSEVATRPDVDQLLDLLDSEIEANGGRKPSRTKKNHDAIRLMLDRDNISAENIAGAIRWCQADEFWRSNILSASKLREKFDQLRLAAQRKRGGPQKSKAAQNADRFREEFGDGYAGGVPAVDAGVGL